ncbi:hypothetical protein O0I10_008679 [Lichtheimia ornata]|uniref:F-box domain-containing protein n=1 Tax=Lichtheimia ornata TaxID=688661 RepID=A0AAD7UZ57_9FUNG|nr:uncharacterized protein O0I10_008679 [Lichtheimia ornata]KAJ8655591.1 hypothetical protein O0I10_008679 [Lichtheimia ornata]
MKLPLEIVHRILLYVDSTDDKRTCLLVCRLWYNIVKRILYKHVNLRSPRQLVYFVSALDSAPSVGEYVRGLAIGYDIRPSANDFDVITRTCRHLEAIDFAQWQWEALNEKQFHRWSHITQVPAISSRRVLGWIGDHSMLQHLHLMDQCLTNAADLVARVPHLKHLTLQSSTEHSCIHLMPIIINASAEGRTTTLQSLTLKGRPIYVIDDVVHFPPSLIDLSLVNVNFGGDLCLTPQMERLHAYDTTIRKEARYETTGSISSLESLSIDPTSTLSLRPFLDLVDTQRLKKLSMSTPKDIIAGPPSQNTIKASAYDVILKSCFTHGDATPIIQWAGKVLTYLELNGAKVDIKRLVYDEESLPHLQHLVISSRLYDENHNSIAQLLQPLLSYSQDVPPSRLLGTLELNNSLIEDLGSMVQWTRRLIVHNCTCRIPPGIGLTISHHRLDTLRISDTRFTYELYHVDHIMDINCRLIGIIDEQAQDDDDDDYYSYRNITEFYHTCSNTYDPIQRLTSEHAESVLRSHYICKDQWKYNPFIVIEQLRDQVFRSICGRENHFGFIAIKRHRIQELRFNDQLVKPIPESGI